MPAIHAVSVPAKTLKTDITSSQSTLPLRDIVWYTDANGTDVLLTAADFGTAGKMFACVEPRTAREEFMELDASTIASYATGIDITRRGLVRTSPYTTEDATRKFAHPSGSKVLIYTNAPQFYGEVAMKANDETVTGEWTFPTGADNPKIGGSYVAPTADTDICTKKYADDLAIAGSPDATTAVKGIVEVATGAEVAAGTATGGTGATLVVPASNCKNSSAGAGDANKVPVLDGSGVLDPTFMPTISRTADNLQVTTDADSDNDAVRKAYLDANAVQEIFGDGSDGDVTISSPTTLTADKYYNNLTLDADLDAAGYKVFVKGTLTRNGTNVIRNNGGNGGNGGNGSGSTGGTAGSAGAAPGSGSLPAGLAGKAGTEGKGTTATAKVDGGAGTAGDAQTYSLTASNGSAGGNGGQGFHPSGGTGAAASGGAGGASTASKDLPKNAVKAFTLIDVSGTGLNIQRPCAASGSGASGGVSAGIGGTAASGGGGGSGGTGGIVFVAVKKIVDNGSGALCRAKGGNGGNAGTSAAATEGGAGGSGGGAGGTGGAVILIYNKAASAPTADVSGGAGGTKAVGVIAGTATKTDGTDGAGGNSGSSFIINV